jgi:selenocysteine lyase/cysteine desulfurase
MSTHAVLPNQRGLFDIPDDVAYLNCAYMSPLMNTVVAAGETAVRQKQRPWEVTLPDFFTVPDQGRELFARIIGAGMEDIAIVPAVSYGVAVAALNIEIEQGQEILLLEDQFPSNVYSWMEKAKSTGARLITLPRIPPPDGVGAQQTWTSRILEAIGPQTAVVGPIATGSMARWSTWSRWARLSAKRVLRLCWTSRSLPERCRST